MADLALIWNNKTGAADLSITANDLTTDDGLETAVYLSLFTNRKQFWGDAVPVVEGDEHGSDLYLLARSKDTQEVLTKAVEYSKAALQWMLDDLVTDRINVTADHIRGAGTSVMLLSVTIYRPTGAAVSFRYNYNWAAQAAKRA